MCLFPKVMAEVGKKARGEAVVAAWSRVVLVIVGGSKVSFLLLPMILRIVMSKTLLDSGDGGSEHYKRGQFSL